MQVQRRSRPRRTPRDIAGDRPRDPRSRGGVTASAFLDRLQMAQVEVAVERDRLLQAVDEAGARLRDDPSLANLYAYRRRVAAVLRSLQREAVAVVTEAAGGGFHRRRLLVWVRVVNQELEALAQMVLAREQDRLAIVAKLDQIRGLLLDLYR